MSVVISRTAEDCFGAALRRFESNADAWKDFRGTMEFVLTGEDGESAISHITIDSGEIRREPGPAPGTPTGRVTMSEADFVLFANGIIDESLHHRRGLLHLEGDMYVLHKLSSLLVTDVPLYEFRTGDVA